ncbi:MAG: hypothetical protein U0790_06950 [Isosphaeraceae bacterium]
MRISFSCPFCRKTYEKDEDVRGKKARCKDCGSVFRVPETAGPAAGPSPVRTAPAKPSAAGSAQRFAPVTALPEDVADPYGLEDVPAISKKAAAYADDGLAGDEWASPTLSRGPALRKRRADRREFFDGLPSAVYLAVPCVLVAGTVLALVTERAGMYVLLGGGGLAFLVLFLYGMAGLVILPFRESLLAGLLCWFVPCYIVGYAIRRWDVMKGPFLSFLASLGIPIALALLLPAISAARGAAMRRDLARGQAAGPVVAEGSVDEALGLPPGQPIPGFVRPGRPGPPPGFPGLPEGIPGRPPGMAGPRRGIPGRPMGVPGPPPGFQFPATPNSLTVIVSGLGAEERRKEFERSLGEALGKVAKGYQVSASDSNGRTYYQIGTTSPIDARAFAHQIPGVEVTRVSGQSIELVIPAR